MFKGEPKACDQARDLVVSQCDVCDACTLEDLSYMGCGVDEAPPEPEEGDDDGDAPVTDVAVTSINWQSYGDAEGGVVEGGGVDEEETDYEEFAEEEEEVGEQEARLSADGSVALVPPSLVPRASTTLTRTRTATSTTRTATTTPTTTSSTRTSTTRTTTTRTQTLAPAPAVYGDVDTSMDETSPCNSECAYMGRMASCTTRVLWGASREFAGEAHACDLGHSLVLEQCPLCSMCLLRDTGCEEARVPSAGLPYECDVGLQDWQEEWDQAKIEWCCKNQGLGCIDQDRESRYDCEADTSTWTAVHARWCCVHKKVGCDVKKYECNTGGAEWESWSTDQKDWCFKHSNFSTLHSCSLDPLAHTNWKHEWRDSKKAWCCQYDERWVRGKKDWCCLREGVGCDSLYNDELNVKAQVDHGSVVWFPDAKLLLAVLAAGMALVALAVGGLRQQRMEANSPKSKGRKSYHLMPTPKSRDSRRASLEPAEASSALTPFGSPQGSPQKNGQRFLTTETEGPSPMHSMRFGRMDPMRR